MDQPSDVLRQHAARGRKIHADLLVARQSKKAVDSNVALGVDALDFFLDLSGKKHLAGRLGRTLGHSSVDKTIGELERMADSWIAESKGILGKISVQRRGIPSGSNSSDLIRSLSAQMRFARPETRLSHGIAYLEDLAGSNVLFNKDLEEMRRTVAIVEKSSPSLPTEVETGLSKVRDLMSAFPPEVEAISGAIAAYKAKGPDWGRQTLDSLRNVLENLVRRLSGESEWSKGLEKVVPSEVSRKSIRATYNLLSVRGVHADEIPGEEDINFSIGLAQHAIKYLIESYEKDGRPGVKKA